MIQIRVTFDIPPDESARFVAASRAVMKHSQAESGCLFYCFSADLSQPSRFHLWEEWASDEHLQTHMKTSHFTSFVRALGECRVQRTTEARSGYLEPYMLRRPNTTQ
jgi:quinol monooxygenase YgiN